MKSPWDILGISKSTDDNYIRNSYKKKSLEFHPDKIGGDGQKFKIIKNAYEQIKDSKSRAKYLIDNKEKNFKERVSFYATQIEECGIQGTGSDISILLKVHIEDCIKGGTVQYLGNRNIRCNGCKGWGTLKKGGHKTCADCNGKGLLISKDGEKIICNKCRGVGVEKGSTCTNCNGSGLKKANVNGYVRLAAGTNDGDLIAFIRNKGNYGRGSNGDLYVFAKLEPNKYISIDGLDIIIKDPITVSMAILGGEKYIYANGIKHKIKIKPGTQSGDRYYVRGGGVTKGVKTGDIVVFVTVSIPSKVSSNLKNLLRTEHNTLKKDGSVGAWHKYISEIFGE